MSKKFILENKFNKILYIILYTLLLLTIGITFLILKLIGIKDPEIFTIIISILLSITLIVKREDILKQMADIYLDLKIWYLKKENQNGLKKVLKELKRTNKPITPNIEPKTKKKTSKPHPHSSKRDYIEIK